MNNTQTTEDVIGFMRSKEWTADREQLTEVLVAISHWLLARNLQIFEWKGWNVQDNLAHRVISTRATLAEAVADALDYTALETGQKVGDTSG